MTYRHDQAYKQPSGRFWAVVAGLMTMVAVVSVLIALACSEASLKRVYREFNYVHVFEDGSFTGQLRDGRQVDGCLPGAQCED